MKRPLTSRVANGTYTNNSHFVPIPQLSVPDADLLLIFLSSDGIMFLNQTDDPWYRATVPGGSYQFDGAVKQSFYVPDEAASPLGCVERFQYCNSSKNCGKLASFIDSTVSALTLFHIDPDDVMSGVYETQRLDATARRFEMFQATLADSQDTSALLIALGPSSLLSLQHLMQGVMGTLPNNQWQLDVSHWFAVRLASIQAAFVNMARGPTDKTLLPYVETIGDEVQRVMCNNQVSSILIIYSFRWHWDFLSVLLINIDVKSENS